MAASMPVSTLTAENDAFGANATPFNEMLKRILKERFVRPQQITIRFLEMGSGSSLA